MVQFTNVMGWRVSLNVWSASHGSSSLHQAVFRTRRSCPPFVFDQARDTVVICQRHTPHLQTCIDTLLALGIVSHGSCAATDAWYACRHHSYPNRHRHLYNLCSQPLIAASSLYLQHTVLPQNIQQCSRLSRLFLRPLSHI
jgi:hypothetical protein